MNAEDLHYCEIYGCKMAAAACVSRHLKSGTPGKGNTFFAAGTYDINCRGCEEGKRLAAKLPREEVNRYKKGLKEVRQNARDQMFAELEAKKQSQTPTEGQMKETGKCPTLENSSEKRKICSRKDCIHKGAPQPLSEFDNNNKTKDGKSQHCKDCRREAQRKYRAKKKEARPRGINVNMKAPDVSKNPSTNSGTKVVVDFAGHPELLKGLKEIAASEFRTPESHILYLISTMSVIHVN